jgi:hypothetical protein
MNNNPDKPFEMPESILKQMEEMSGGGFIIFILDSDNVPAVYESFDGMGQESQVKNFAIDWLDSEREARKELLKQGIMDSLIQNQEDEEDEEDEEE